MAYVRKSERQPANNTGIQEAGELFTTEELAYANMLSALFDAQIKSETPKRSRVGSFHGMYEVGFNSAHTIVPKLKTVLLDANQWEIAERLIVAHGYVCTFGMM